MRVRGDCQVEMSLKRDPPGFPFSLLAPEGFPFSLGILPLLPSCYPALAGFIGKASVYLYINIYIHKHAHNCVYIYICLHVDVSVIAERPCEDVHMYARMYVRMSGM